MGNRLANKICVVTGAASGIGAGIARRFAREGAWVVLADVNEESVREIERDIRRSGGECEAHKTDVGSEREIAELFRRVGERHGKLHILSTNAYWAAPKNAVDTSLEEWNRCMAVTLTAPFLCSKHAVQLMRVTGGGSIVHTSSVGGVVAFQNNASYMTAKAGVIQLCKSIAVDFAADGIRCNAICPGIIDTPSTRSDDTEELRRLRMSKTLAGRYGTPDDIASAALYLASDEAGFVTGTAMMVDSGWSII
ncbi:SDR family oxidoreductase [Paenibacillus mesophilus]|uniref:SDR family NAD(P)-dependent oxidoreductase n=1 Tax=Paenibacillus mesophilus TaxID=2582849 RepID=UPI00110F59E7|nr:SDR family oxidoreductase [Paenibacillus mesophilus]TMV48965.1 SDR family oxidoreductase [Paenibacillus mesophilus]